jgi:hypothetical protein
MIGGNYAYILTSIVGDTGIHIFDLTNPIAPVEVGFFDGPSIDYLTVKGDYVYFTDLTGLHILNVSNPAIPIEIGFYRLARTSGVLAVTDNYVYNANGDWGLMVFQVASPTAATIPTSGGSLTPTSDQTSYIFSPGTFNATTVVTHTARLPGNGQPQNGLVPIRHYFDVVAVNSDTGQPVQPTQPYSITLHYTNAELGPAIEGTLALYEWNGTAWVKEPSSAVNPTTNTLTAQPTHFSLWAALAETQRTYLPIVDNR